MLVLTFPAQGQHNCVEVAGMPFVYARSRLGSFVLPASCPHRGGPLQLANVEPQSDRLVCPWHGRRLSATRPLRAGIPAVRRGDFVTAVFPHPDHAPVHRRYRPLSPDLSQGDRSP